MTTNTLGKYHIIREIARSNDIVYEAMDPSRGLKIALKELLMPPNLTGQSRLDRIQRFTREARAAASLQHTNIVRIHDHGNLQGRYYIAMEYLQGQSLRDVLRQRGTLPIQESLRIAAAVANGLEFAHRHGVVHRDVKPDNVHLEPDGRVVITDFGIARISFEPSLTADGQIFGTPSYMSPEQVAGKNIDARSDIFSLGVMLYEMISGRKPFAGDSVITITYNIMNAEPSPLMGVPPALDQVVRTAMAKEAGRRFRGAGDLAEDLQAIARGEAPRHLPGPPRHASVWSTPMPASTPASYAPVGQSSHSYSGGGSSPAQRPVLPSIFGTNPIPSGASLPGARPLPGFPSGGVNRSRGQPGGALLGQLPPPSLPPVYQNRHQRAQSASNAFWLLGWLGVALVIGGMVLGVVWAGVMAYEKFSKDQLTAASVAIQTDANRAYEGKHYEQAMNGFVQAAEKASGPEKLLSLQNAAQAAERLADQRLAAGKHAEAEALGRKAISLNPDLAAAHVITGRALTQQGKLEEAIQQFDEAVLAASRTKAAGGSQEAIRSAEQFGKMAPLWKAEALYKDGMKQLGSNNALSRQRFQAVIQAAPGSQFAQNAQVELVRMGPADPTGEGEGGADDPPGGAGIPGTPAPGNPQRPDLWDFVPPDLSK